VIECLVVTAAEAAKMLKLNPKETGRRLEIGEIPATRDGREWKIPKTTLQKYIEDKAIEEARERRKLYEKIQMEQGEV